MVCPVGGSSNGRTPSFGGGYPGSNPGPPVSRSRSFGSNQTVCVSSSPTANVCSCHGAALVITSTRQGSDRSLVLMGGIVAPAWDVPVWQRVEDPQEVRRALENLDCSLRPAPQSPRSDPEVGLPDRNRACGRFDLQPRHLKKRLF